MRDAEGSTAQNSNTQPPSKSKMLLLFDFMTVLMFDVGVAVS
jgi:hypothetical protein